MTKSVMICAGEASGDLHAANLIYALRKLQPELDVRAMGSSQLEAASADMLVDCRDIAVVGIVEVIKHWGEIQTALQILKDSLKDNPPDLLILVDYVEFNLKLAKYAKSLGIKVLFYVSPQVWAWRSGRVPKIGKVIDMMAVLFPFETEIYEKYNVPVRFVGHPLADEVHPTMSKTEAQNTYGLNTEFSTVGLLPGSRRGEVERILPTLLESAKLIQQTLGSVQFVLPIAPTLERDFVQGIIDAAGVDIQLIDGDSHNVIHACEAVMVASGTATLEVALLETPMSIVYKVSPISYQILSRMIEIEHIGLANIVAGKAAAPEFIQHYAEPHIIATEVVKQLTDLEYRSQMITDMQQIKIKLGAGGGSKKIAELANDMLEGRV